jgi:hypothetical protein
LLLDPFCRRVRCHIDPDKLSPSQPDNDQNVELEMKFSMHTQSMHAARLTAVADISSTDEISSVVIFTCQPIPRPNGFLSNES